METDPKFLQALAEIDEALNAINDDPSVAAVPNVSSFKPCGGGAMGKLLLEFQS